MKSERVSSELREGFKQRFADALRRRLSPNSNLTVPVFAHAMRRSEATVWSWLGGSRSPRGEDVMACISFFAGDFACEITAGTGATVLKLSDRRATEAVQRFVAATEELKQALDGGSR